MKKIIIILIIVILISTVIYSGDDIKKIPIIDKKGIGTKEIPIPENLLTKAQQNPDAIQRVIITFSKKPEGYKQFTQSLGGRMIHDYDIIEGIAITLPGRAIERLKELKNLASIQEDRKVHAFLTESVPLINADDVWALGYNGSGKTVCVVDTGIDYNHPALTGKVVAQKCYCYKPGAKGCCPNNLDEDNNAMDDNGHGTHCAGIVASTNTTYRGVAYGADLMAVKVLDSSGSGYESDVIAGINWCSAQNPDVISISLGGGLFSSYCDSEADAEAVNNAVDAGAVVSVASGNDASTTAISAPACASKAISVGDVYDADVGGIAWSACTDSTTYADKIVCHSNRNNILDLLAPGALIMSTVLNNDFDEYGGTSMAAPHVSGAAALLLEANPTLTPAEIESILKNTGVDIYDSGSGLTFPRIDVLAAVTLPPLGHLEPYLIDPISDKNVTQNEFFTFNSGVKCVGGECGNVSATLDPETEIYYDDGGANTYWTDSNFIWAVRFTSPFYPLTITKAKVQFYDPAPSVGSYIATVHVYDDNNGALGNELITPFDTVIDTFYSSWEDITLNVSVFSGDFWIGITAPGDPDGPYALTDGGTTTSRSIGGDGSTWYTLDEDLMLRAFVVEGAEGYKGTIPINNGTPFYTISPNPQNSSNLACLQNMQAGDTCNQTWQVNATGEINTSYDFFTIYDSITYDNIETNRTSKVNITIVEAAAPSEFISITLIGYPIGFGNLDQNTNDNPASGNDANQYIIRIDPETTVNTDIYQKGEDFTTNGYTLAIGNMSWNTENNVVTSINMTNNYQDKVAENVANGTDINMYYWIDIPLQRAGDYTSTIYIKAVETGTPPE